MADDDTIKVPELPDGKKWIKDGITNLWKIVDKLEGEPVYYTGPKCTCGVDHVRCGGRHSTWCDIYKEGE